MRSITTYSGALAGLAMGLAIAACSPAAPAPRATPAAQAPAGAPASGDAVPQIAIGVTVGVARPAGGTPIATAAPAPPAAAQAVSAPVNAAESTFRFQRPLGSTAQIDEVVAALKRDPGVLDARASLESITVRYDAASRSPEQVRDLLAAAQHPVEP